MKYLKKLVNEGHSLVWTLAGTALVLITLSGDTKTKGLWISGGALFIHIGGILLQKEESK